MGGMISRGQGTCTFCGVSGVQVDEYYPHEKGQYSLFVPDKHIELACSSCSYIRCSCCLEKQPRFGIINCEKCGTYHCYNNTDMVYENNPILSFLSFCDKHKNCTKTH